jgi:galactose mutarotase-like enzyme
MTFTYEYAEPNDLDVVRGRGLTLTVRRLGAEVIGLTRHAPAGDVGLLWRNGELADPPRFWKSHATNLFPIVGGVHDLRSRTTTGVEVRFQKQHGFVRHRRLALLGWAADARHGVLHYHLSADAETLALYPWRFELWITYELRDDRLQQTMMVVNRDDRPMPFQIGWHPGFNAPFRRGTKAAGHLRLPRGELVQLENDEHCHLTGRSERVSFAGDFPFTERGLDRTYMFDLSAVPPEQRAVDWLDPDGEFGVRVTFPDYPHLGLWSDADAPFLCIEPWHGMDDAVTQEPFDRKFGVILLPPGEERRFRAAIQVIEQTAARVAR